MWAVCVFLDPTYAIVVAILFGLLRSARNEKEVAPGRWREVASDDPAEGRELAVEVLQG